jgi:hypothetical protein
VNKGRQLNALDHFNDFARRTTMATDDNTKTPLPTDLSRRNMLKGAGALAATVGLSAVDPTSAQAQAGCEPPVNPYGGGSSKGLQFPPYYKPTSSVPGRMNYRGNVQ